MHYYYYYFYFFSFDVSFNLLVWKDLAVFISFIIVILVAIDDREKMNDMMSICIRFESFLNCVIVKKPVYNF